MLASAVEWFCRRWPSVASLEAGTVAGAPHLGSTVGYKCHLASEDIDELIRRRLPMALAGPCSREQAKKVYAELGETGGVTQFFVLNRAKHGSS